MLNFISNFILFFNLNFILFFCNRHFSGMPYLFTYFTFNFTTLTFSCCTFFGDDAMLTRGCFSGGHYNNSEISTSKCFFWYLLIEMNGGVTISFVALDK